MDWTSIKNKINTNFKDNTNQDITAAKLRETLLDYTDAIDAGVADEIAEVSSRVIVPAYTSFITATEKETGKFFTISGTAVSYAANASMKYYKFPVTASKQYVIDSFYLPSAGYSGVVGWAFCNSAGTVLTRDIAHAGPINERMLVVAPTNASYILVNSFISGNVNFGEFSGYSLANGVIESGSANSAALPGGADLNEIADGKVWLLSSDYLNTYLNKPEGLTSLSATMVTFNTGGADRFSQQVIFGTTGRVWTRFIDRANRTYYAWSEMSINNTSELFRANSRVVLPNGTDLNTISDNNVYILDSNNHYENMPYGLITGMLWSYRTYSVTLQMFANYPATQVYIRSCRNAQMTSGGWSAWSVIAGGKTVNATNNYTTNTYNNTYNVTATPKITSDTNNYLASTNDSTDRTAEIVAMLKSTGVCKLGPGEFYINGLVMPNDTSIIGSGIATKLVLATGAEFGIQMKKWNVLEDFSISGKENGGSSLEIGNRKGIMWVGDYNTTSTYTNCPERGMIRCVYFENIKGSGLYMSNTGYSILTGCSVSECNFYGCDCGINIAYWSEFSRFTGCQVSSCGYGVINNGGNNTFVNCDFSSNKEAFLIDNQYNQSTNNTHGGCIGCIFNHSNSNAGVGIRVLNGGNGFIFDGCQIFYSQIIIDGTSGVVVSNCNFGQVNCKISVESSKAILFANNLFQGAVETSINDSNVVWSNNLLRSNGAEFKG